MSAAGAASEAEAKGDAGKAKTLTSANWVLFCSTIPHLDKDKWSGPRSCCFFFQRSGLLTRK